jgi:hypothetical protein
MSESWDEAYAKGRLSSQRIAELADELETVLHYSGAFAVHREHERGSKSLPHREKQSLIAYCMEPLTLGEGWFEDGAKHYAEQALFLRIIKATFGPKKAFLGVGACPLVLTQHMLERTYERTEVSHQAFAAHLHGQIDALVRAVALLDAGELWIADPQNWISAVPFANGLLILNKRLVFGRPEEGHLGFHLEVPRHRLQTPYINANLKVEKLSTEDFAAFTPNCSLTYYNLATLSDVESDYYYAFQALREHFGEEDLASLALLLFSPNLAHENWGAFGLTDRCEQRRQRVSALLRSGWLKTEKKQPIACMLPFGTQPPFRPASNWAE